MTNTMTTTMNTELESDFRQFAASALRLAPHLLAGATPEQLQLVDRATAAGARLVLEFGPLPAFTGARLVLIEREGARHALGEVKANPPPVLQ